jgi:hypothetical protein
MQPRTASDVRLLAPLRGDLRKWRLKSGRPDEEALVFPRFDGAPWNDEDWRNWRQRIFAPAATAAGLDNFRPYDLRHSFVSLLFAEGKTVIEVARQAGHSPTMALATYGHVIEELEGSERQPAEDVIRAARARRVPSVFPQRGASQGLRSRQAAKVAANRGKPSDGLEPSTPSLPWNVAGNQWQPMATVSGLFLRLRRRSDLPLIATGSDRGAP